MTKSNPWPVDYLLAVASLKPREVLDHGLRIRVLIIGPKEAAALLAANHDNRALRPGRVKFYERVMGAGGWMLTHQGIAFSVDGAGIDLQHRLQAVINSGVEVRLMVVEGLERSAFEAIDQHERRSLADALRLPREVCEVARFLVLAAIADSSPLPRVVDEVACTIADAHGRLCPTRTKLFASTPVRAAATILMLERPVSSGAIADAYRNLVLMRSENYTRAMHAFSRQASSTKANTNSASKRIDLFSRALTALDPRPGRENVSKIQITSVDTGRDRARAALGFAQEVPA